MCVILELKPNQMIPFDKFENAVFNNPDGYGIVMLEGGRMSIKRECPEGGNDPETIYKQLDEHKDVMRYLHLRYNTKGSTDISNVHPFDVISSEHYGDVVFMHNGTLHSYAPPTTAGTNDLRSDSRVFTENFLTPLFSRIKSEMGDPFFHSIIEKHWSTASKGLILSSKHDPIWLGSWVDVENLKEERVVKASNNDYFDKLKRGPEFEQREQTN